MKKFEIVLKNEKVRLYNRFAVFITVLNIIAAVYFFYFKYGSTLQNTISLIALVLLILTTLIYIAASLKKKKEFAFLFSVIGFSVFWILIGYWWIGLIVLILFYLYTKAKRQLNINLSDQIIYPSFPKHTIHWNELNNVILKDGLLTIDFKNNKLSQHIIQYPEAINEKEFNEFCKEQLIINH